VNAITVFCVGAVQLNVALRDCAAMTWIEKAFSAVVALPSLTLIWMFEYVPAFEAEGVPESCPVEVLKLAHEGRFAIENVSVSPFASDAVGRKLYAEPAFTDVAGVPLIVGALFDGVAADTVIVNADNDFESLPSLTLMMILLCVPVAVGVPDNVPVEVEKLAQLGLF
jgi:hypothetical protein